MGKIRAFVAVPHKRVSKCPPQTTNRTKHNTTRTNNTLNQTSVSFQPMKQKFNQSLKPQMGSPFNDKCEQFSQRSFTTRDPFHVTIEKYYKLIKTLYQGQKER